MKRIFELDVFKIAHELTLRLYDITRGMPAEERYGLTAQIRRSAASINMNLVEGSARKTKNDFSHFIVMATGSCRELQYQILLARDLGYMDVAVCDEMQDGCVRIEQMLHKLYASQQ